MMKRTISGMIGAGSLAHNRRDFVAENVNPDRVQLNICYKNENLKEVYKELFDDAVERYNVGKRKDRQIANYYEKIRQSKQEKLFHEVIFQIGNREDMAVDTTEGDLAVRVLDEYMKDFQKRNPSLRVFNCYLHQDEATPHLHIDFVPYVTNWKGKGMDTRVSLKQALKSLGFQGGNKHDTELNQWINHEKEVLAEIAKQHGIEWEQKGTWKRYKYRQTWQYLKGAKKLLRTSSTGHEYVFSEGAISMIDQEDKPARTMLTSEGGFSRTTHIVKDKMTGRVRLLTATEAERIQGFPTDHTKYCLVNNETVEMPLRKRRFMMGNALVVNLVEDMEKTLDQIFENE